MNPRILRGILEALRAEIGKKRCLLDASAGDGTSSARYRELGFEVTASDYDPSTFEVQGIPCIRADLNEQ